MTRRTLEIAAFCIALIVAALAVHAWLASRDEQQRLAATLAAQKQVIDSASADERARQASLSDALAQIEKLKRDVQTPAQILAALPKYLQLPQPITLSQPVPSPNAAASTEQGTAVKESSRDSPVGAQSANNSAPMPGADSCRDAAHSTTLPGGAAHVECGGLPADKAGLPPLSAAGALSAAVGGASVAQNTAGASSRTPQIPAIAPSVEAPQQSTPATPCDPAGNCVAQIPSADLKPLFDYVQNCRECQAQLAAAQKNSADDAAKISALTRERDAAVTASKGGTFWRQLRRNALWFAIGAAGGYIAAHR